MDAEASDAVAALRRFNRSHTRRIGLLNESYLDSGLALGPLRALHEIGDEIALLDLRRRLDLDSGYVSRLLRQLEELGLARVERHPEDGRQRIARLTEKGRRERRGLDERSDQLAWRLLRTLTPSQRTRLTDALATADRLLDLAALRFETVDPTSPSARNAIERYFAELDERFASGFDPGDGGAESDSTALRGPSGAFVIVRDGEEVVGYGGVQQVDESTAEIKRMWIAPEWRGLGLGPQLLSHLEGLACRLAHRRIVLDTNEALYEAVAMYERAGYEPIERYNDNPYAHHWFAKTL